ncbi:uracil-DNA glycosylase [Flavobacterium agricola]|uniref:Uracil-DNA glycosylase n=1 Tax=Flavobacterium agricola TaxID=2870839 RepID=A0ABY6M1B8_9FLAO|nr:uracil-DNA glycosylase [Flavobacterium agricola]UYW02042.1 uracil-DNA glycosylase [Flavobacterium agricola]
MQATWTAFLAQEKEEEYFTNLMQFVLQQYDTTTVFPPKSYIFNAFDLTPLNAIKVVIIGQDPYHGPNQANGLAFSVADGMPFPPSLRNIFKEVQADFGSEIPFSGNLERWALQGVFLLNDVLTVEQSKPGSHQKKGWEKFTDRVIAHISDNTQNTVFLLWGNYAHKKGKNIDRTKHLVLESGHPSPMSANQGKWFNNKHFSQANSYLLENDKTPIVW